MSYEIDPELAPVLEVLPDIDARDVPAARRILSEMVAAAPAPDLGGVEISEQAIPGAQGPEITVRLYCPETRSGAGVILQVHGGGFLMGDLEVDHARNIVLARELGVLVVAVDYRLAPEHPYPAGLEDVYTTLEWIVEHHAKLGIDPAQILVKGASAGAGLCAALALAVRERGGPAIAFQFLAIPELDDRLITDSATRFNDTPNWQRRNAQASWDAYLGAADARAKDVAATAAPARAENLSGLPPAYISVAQFDPLRDEGLNYARALLATGVPVELHLFPGTFHGSTAVDAAISRRELDEELTVLRTVLQRLLHSTSTSEESV